MLRPVFFPAPYQGHAASGQPAWPRLSASAWGLVFISLFAGLLLHWGVDGQAWMVWIHANPVVPEALWAGLTLLGFGWAILILIHALDREDGRFALAASLSVVLGGLLIGVVKAVLPIARPVLVLGESQLTVIGVAVMRSGSMPSGHAAAAMAMVTLAILCLHSRGGLSFLRLMGLLVLGVLVAWSRVAVGAHWPADVLVGAALGVITAVVALHVANHWWNPAQAWTRARARQKLWWLCATELLAAAVCFGTETGQPQVWWLQAVLGTLGVVSCLSRLWQGLMIEHKR